MSEGLIKHDLTEGGLQFGPYEFFPLDHVTIKQLRDYKIIPNRAYPKEVLPLQPDGLLVDRRGRQPKVLAVVEYKDPNEFNTPNKVQKAAEQCVYNYCKPLKALVGVVTDRTDYARASAFS